jgi:hypothetical protein
MGSPDPRVTRILDKLAAVRERRIETFGSNGRYALSPSLTEAEVRALERRHGIELPEAFRAFVTQVGACGAGPYYGIVPPERWNHALYGDVAMPDFAARPCVWTADLPRDDPTWNRVSAGMDEPFQGSIVIADQGCAYCATLVVTGRERGRVMYINLDGGVPFFPENPDFLSWYERWLDELLWGFRHFWYGTAMPGNEDTLARVAGTPDSPRRLDALRAMHQLPSLRSDTQAIVASRIRDDDPAVRAAALGVAAKFALTGPVEVRVRGALTDDSPAVRLAALRARIAAGGAWHDDARRALGDAPEVAVAALQELDKAKLLTVDELLPLIASPVRAVLDTALFAARTIPSERVFDAVLALIDAGSDDPHSLLLLAVLAQIRLGTVDGARRDIALGLVLARLAAASGPEPPTAAIYGLGAFVATHPRAQEALIELTGHVEPFYRYEAAAVLGDVGDTWALPALRALTTDKQMPRAPNRSTAWSVGENARRAISRIAERTTKAPG